MPGHINTHVSPDTRVARHVRTSSSIVSANHVGHILLRRIEDGTIETEPVSKRSLKTALTASYTTEEM
jgi:hypothetical protein